MRSKIAGIALLAIGIPLAIYGVITYASIVNDVNMGKCSLNPVSNLPKCEDATDYGMVAVVGILVLGGGIAILVMSKKRTSTITQS